MSRRAWLTLALGLGLGITSAASVLLRPSGGGSDTTPASAPISLPPLGQSTLARRYALLAGAHSNQCGLAGSVIGRLPPGSRLQGSCCRRMDLQHYREQINGLQSYRGLAEVPRDPYDVPVVLARRLLFDRSVELTPRQAVTYRDASRVTSRSVV